MADTGLAQLGALRIQAQQRSDQVNSGFITTPEWNSMLSLAYKDLYDLLVTSYGDEYEFALPYNFQTSSANQLYPLPNGLTTIDAITSQVAVPFYKLCGVDLQVTSAPDSWVTLRRFEFTERNRYWLANQYAVYGIITLRYKVIGTNLWLTPVPVPSQTIQLWYVPKPVNLQPIVTCGLTNTSPVVTTADTSQLVVGMNVADLALMQGGTPLVPAAATILSIVPGVSFTMSANATATAPVYLVAAWSDATTLDGVSGWEEYVILTAAIKAMIKEESDPQPLMVERADIKQRIIDTAAGRDASLPARVSDSQSIDLGYPGGDYLGGGGGAW